MSKAIVTFAVIASSMTGTFCKSVAFSPEQMRIVKAATAEKEEEPYNPLKSQNAPVNAINVAVYTDSTSKRSPAPIAVRAKPVSPPKTVAYKVVEDDEEDQVSVGDLRVKLMALGGKVDRLAKVIDVIREPLSAFAKKAAPASGSVYEKFVLLDSRLDSAEQLLNAMTKPLNNYAGILSVFAGNQPQATNQKASKYLSSELESIGNEVTNLEAAAKSELLTQHNALIDRMMVAITFMRGNGIYLSKLQLARVPKNKMLSTNYNTLKGVYLNDFASAVNGIEKLNQPWFPVLGKTSIGLECDKALNRSKALVDALSLVSN